MLNARQKYVFYQSEKKEDVAYDQSYLYVKNTS
jgi:hypothetical protein